VSTQPQEHPSSDAVDPAIARVRDQWKAGERRAYDMRSWSDKHPVIEHVIDALMYELGRRVGQTFSMKELIATYGSADLWAQQLAIDTAPGKPWAWEMDIVMDAAFHRYSRRASDYTP
jgi:hypothetical protein